MRYIITIYLSILHPFITIYYNQFQRIIHYICIFVDNYIIKRLT
jgi:hypothetical protein